MTIRGKSINLFLMDGSVTGCIKCSLSNWTGIAYKIPRTELDNCKNRNDLKQSGVYFLFGKSDQTGEDVVYIGQASARKNGEGILNRLLEHKRNPEKDYWTEAVVFTTSNNSFGPTEISYLENRFAALATEAHRYRVTNGNEPTSGNTTEEKESELEEFVDYAMIVMGTLGHKVFIPISRNEISLVADDGSVSHDSEPTLCLNTAKANAKGKRTSDGFVVFKGSKVASAPTKSCPDSVKSLRKKNTDRIDINHTLTEDVLFSSPSAAAGFVNYASANGLIMWVAENGKTLKELESKE